jgi:hypothetical protein
MRSRKLLGSALGSKPGGGSSACPLLAVSFDACLGRVLSRMHARIQGWTLHAWRRL